MLDDRILDAAIRRLHRNGYAGLRVDDVAADAGVAKTTLYRRCPSKEALVADAVRHLYTDRVGVIDTGDLRLDLLTLVRESHAVLSEGPGRALEELVRQSGASRELAAVVRSTNDARRRAFHEALNRAVARGEIDPTVQHELVIDMLVGPIWTRRLVTDRAYVTALWPGFRNMAINMTVLTTFMFGFMFLWMHEFFQMGSDQNELFWWYALWVGVAAGVTAIYPVNWWLVATGRKGGSN